MTALRLAAIVLLLAIGGADAAPATVRIGDLLLDYDDRDWQVAAGPDGAVIIATDCDVPRCDHMPGIAVAFGPVDGPLPREIPSHDAGFVQSLWALLGDDGAAHDDPIRTIGGFTVFATDRWSGCRAMSPSELTAILDHGGRRYTFTSGLALACSGVWGVPREDFVAVLSGLRPAP